MSSWATLLAATGFKVDAPNAALTIAPVVRQAELIAPWVTSSAWGALRVTGDTLELGCRGGTLAVRTLKINLPGKRFQARLGARRLDVRLSGTPGLMTLDFGQPLRVSEGDLLKVTTA
jgi:hypothetical protein